jgi:hypothetical protein
MANRSISVSLDEGLRRRRVAALNTAYAHLASLDAADLQAAAKAAVAMGQEAMAVDADGLRVLSTCRAPSAGSPLLN